MEAQQDKAYGEGFRQGVTRLLDEVAKLGVLSSEVQDKITANAAKLCMAEAIAEQKATEMADRAKAEWLKQQPQLQASLERFADAAVSAAKEFDKAVKSLFDSKKDEDSTH